MRLIRAPTATTTPLRSLIRSSPPIHLSPPPQQQQQQRSIRTSPPSAYQHLLYLGNILGYQSIDRLSLFPRAWLDSVGVSSDVDHGLKWTSASSSPSHTLLSYTLVANPLDRSKRPRQASEELSSSHSTPFTPAFEEQGEAEAVVLEEDRERKDKVGVSKVFGIGRNTHAQLGLGFASQEATRGMFTASLEGSGGVQKVVAGSGFSFVVTSADTGSMVYGFGNDTLGQLGSCAPQATISGSADPYDISTRLPGSDVAQLRLLPLPKRISIDSSEHTAFHEGREGSSGWRVIDLAAGIDHSLLLLERELNGFRIQSLLTTGLNTDGQLGSTPPSKSSSLPIHPLITRHFTPVPLPLEPIPTAINTDAGQITAVVAHADTSYALTRTGELWVWGNSEYGQSFAGVHDRLPIPIHLPNPLPAAYSEYDLSSGSGPRIKKLVAGGSYAAILDNNGRVWVCGFLPSTPSEHGPPKEKEQWGKLRLVEGFPENIVVEDLYSGLEYLVAITRDAEAQVAVWIWGIPPRSISSLPIATPTKVPFTVPSTPREKYLDETPTVRAQMEKESKEKGKKAAEKLKATMRVEHVACTRDHFLLLLQDGLSEKGLAEENVWAESIGPPQGKPTDVAL